MTPFKPEWLEHRRRRYTRPDASRYFRPDYERYLRPDHARFDGRQTYEPKYRPDQPYGSEESALAAHTSELLKLKSELDRLLLLRAAIRLEQLRRKAGFNPAQPRVPAGNADSGQWTNDGGGGAAPRTGALGAIKVAESFNPGSHHFVPQSLFNKLPLPPETRKVFDEAKTAPLLSERHGWSKEHRIYNDAITEHFDRFMKENSIRPEEMAPDQARRFVEEVKRSSDPRIRGLNMRIYMREIMYWLRRVPRGNE
jgi:hypothetical protein